MEAITNVVNTICNWFNGRIFTIPLPGGGSIDISILVLLLIPTGIYFTIRTKCLPVRCFREMLHISAEKKTGDNDSGAISGLQALIVSTATRVGMGNLMGVVAAVSVGGAGAVFWMWITALIGSATAYVEATLAQQYKEKDPLYGGYRGGPAQYIHGFFQKDKTKRYCILAVLFAASGLICWGGISQVISNSVTSAFEGAFSIPPIYTTIVLVAFAAVIVLRKNATVKVLDIMVPIMAILYFVLAVFVICKNITMLPQVMVRIVEEAFGLRQMAGGGIGFALMKGVQRGLFSNEAGSGSAPCAAAAADVSHPAKSGLLQSLGVFIDTLVICTCTAMIMLLVPEGVATNGSEMEMLQAAMYHHFGYAGVIFIAITLFLFCFSTFIGVLYYARPNVAYLCGDNWWSQNAYKIFALVMLFIGGISTSHLVWGIGDIGLALMTVFNIIAILPMGSKAIKALDEYMAMRKAERKQKRGSD